MSEAAPTITPKSALHMKEPIWVWLYDYGPASNPEGWKGRELEVKAYPQAHTNGFRSEADARAEPQRMGWAKDHPYVLQKVYLNGVAQPESGAKK